MGRDVSRDLLVLWHGPLMVGQWEQPLPHAFQQPDLRDQGLHYACVTETPNTATCCVIPTVVAIYNTPSALLGYLTIFKWFSKLLLFYMLCLLLLLTALL